MNKLKLIRITTVPVSLKTLLKGQLRFMNNYFDVLGVSSSGTDLQETSNQEGIRIHAVEMTRSITPLRDFIAIINLILLFRKEKPFIVHTHTPKAGLLGMIAARLTGVPNRFHTVAGLPLIVTMGAKRKMLNFTEKLTYFCATKVYPNSHGLFNIILDNKFTYSEKLKVIANGSSNGIDTTFFSIQNIPETQIFVLKRQLKISETDFVFLFVGRIVSDKGINELIKAFTFIQSKLQDVKLLLVGPLESKLDPLNEFSISQIVENKNIISVGYQDDVRPYFAISNVLVFPSYREGFPNVVLQAGSMGLPCIVSDINGCNEIIDESLNGLIIPVKNLELLKNAMLNIACNGSLEMKLKYNSRKMITSRFEQSVVWESILEEYISVKNK